MHAHTRAFAHGALDGADGASDTPNGRTRAAEPSAADIVGTYCRHLRQSVTCQCHLS